MTLHDCMSGTTTVSPSDSITYLPITVSLYIALKIVQWTALLGIFYKSFNETGKCLGPWRVGLRPFLDCELNEKNGIIVTAISGIEYGVCPSSFNTHTWCAQCCPLEYTEAFTLIFQMQKPSSRVGELSPSRLAERESNLTAIPETMHAYRLKAWFIPFPKHI